jgi:FecR protein
VSSLKGSPHFEVDTATGVAAVRSTDWLIEAQPGSTQVGVLEGRVSLKSVATGKEIVIPAHWGARVEAGRDPVPARVWTGAEFDNFIRQPQSGSRKRISRLRPCCYSRTNGAGAEARRAVAVERPDRDPLRIYRPVTPASGTHLGFEDVDERLASIGDSHTWTLPGRMTRELIDELESARETVAGK